MYLWASQDEIPKNIPIDLASRRLRYSMLSPALDHNHAILLSSPDELLIRIVCLLDALSLVQPQNFPEDTSREDSDAHFHSHWDSMMRVVQTLEPPPSDIPGGVVLYRNTRTRLAKEITKEIYDQVHHSMESMLSSHSGQTRFQLGCLLAMSIQVEVLLVLSAFLCGKRRPFWTRFANMNRK